MPLRAIKPDGSSILAFDLSKDLWNELKSTKPGKELQMACCASPAVMKTSRKGTQFFAHKHQGECHTAPETEDHLKIKAIAVQVARSMGWEASTEVPGVAPDGSRWIADVMATKNSAKIAIEVQWSTQTDEESLFRQERYRQSGVRAIWLMRQPNFPMSKDFPAVCINHDAEGNCTVMLPRIEQARSKSRDYEWSSKVPIHNFLRAFSEKKFWFGRLRSNHPITLQVFGAENKCWRCKGSTRTVSSCWLRQEGQGGETVSFGLQDIDGKAMLGNLLLPKVKLIPNVGAIKERYSKTAQGKYLSNGCVHCDALQGRFYDFDFENKCLLKVELSPAEIDFEINEINKRGGCWNLAD